MDHPSLIIVPPTPAAINHHNPSPLSTDTASSIPDLTPPSSVDPQDRTSSETTIFTIYSMYGEEEPSWSAENDLMHRKPSNDVDVTVTRLSADYHDSYLQPNGHVVDDGGLYYPAKYEPRRATKRYSMAGKPRTSVLSDDSSQQPSYSDSRTTSTYLRSSTISRSMSDTALEDGPLRHSTPPRSQPQSRAPSRPTSRLPSRPNSSHNNNNIDASRELASLALPPLPPSPASKPSPPQQPQASTSSTPPHVIVSLPESTLLHLPATPPQTPPKRPHKLSTGSPDSKRSIRSLVPVDGEDPDGFHVRNTYAQLDQCGVKGDGYEEGVERTRAKVGGNRDSELRAEAALADENEKTRELTPKELEMLGSLDRYGFFVTPSHDRLILLPAAPLAKPLSHILSPTTNASANAPPLRSPPPIQPSTKESSRTAKWGRMLEAKSRDEGGNVESWRVKRSKERKLSERVFKGIPDCWRSAAWDVLMSRYSNTGPAEMRQLGEAYREALDLPSSYDVQIDLDVPRTISGHVMFRTRYGQGQRSLFHVLHSLSLRCEECGYCQGMGPLAATLLCYFDPERVYASLVRLHDAYSMHSIFSPGFPGLLEAIYVQERITEEMMPGVYAAFKRHMISTTSYATKWYITLFANSVPFQTQLRLWDAFILEGHDTFVVVAIAIVWVYRDHITSDAANFESVLSLLSSFFVPESEDALLAWIEKAMSDKKLRSSMQHWREDWKRLVASGQQDQALL